MEIVLVALVVAVIVLYVKMNDQTRQILTLKSKLIQLEHLLTQLKIPSVKQQPPSDSAEQPIVNQHSEQKPNIVAQLKEVPVAKNLPVAEDIPVPTNIKKPKQKQASSHQVAKPKIDIIEQFMAKNGLLWLGAIVLSLGGIFLAKYAIEANMLPPYVRLFMGAFMGVALVFIANFLYQNPQKYNINSPLISAALSAGGVITLYSVILVAFMYYAYLTPLIAFALLAIVSLTSTGLALRFGPLLAVIGMLGAYAVPGLVNTGSENLLGLLLYVAVISSANLWLAQRVQRSWLERISFLGHFGWAIASILIVSSSNFFLYLVFLLLSLYLFNFNKKLGWLLGRTQTASLSMKQLFKPSLGLAAVFVSTLLLFLTSELDASSPQLIATSVIISGVFAAVAFRHSAYDYLPFIALAFAVFAMSQLPTEFDELNSAFLFSGKLLYVQIAALIGSIASFLMVKRFPTRSAFHLLLVLMPLSFYGVGYGLLYSGMADEVYFLWATELLILAALATWLVNTLSEPLQKVSLSLFANACITLVITMLLSASTLTLALAIQVCFAFILTQKYKVSIPHWIFKLALTLVMLRLTLAPWLPSYSEQSILGLHFSIVIYPIVIALLAFTLKLMPKDDLKQWFEGALLHLIALFFLTETSIVLTGDYLDLHRPDYQTLVLLAFSWIVLAFVYLWRAKLSQNTGAKIYKYAGYLLTAAVLAIHLDISIARNPFWTSVEVGEWLVVNWLFLLWAGPALAVLIAVWYFNLMPNKAGKVLLIISGLWAFLYINGNIRIGFAQNNISLLSTASISQAELYTYSLVWMVISVIFILLARQLKQALLMRTGFVILLTVVLKVFIFDASGLEGLLRALSFIVLGLVLVALGWLFQKIKRDFVQQPEQETAHS
ncbi:DUF2339 domain-containing protein [Glaciecola sp. 1036]|uniref:DUF2339 domain-containing protein n=1 Tax=Alteromonadaceae TaxID=72275 RepID=UPI003D06216D